LRIGACAATLAVGLSLVGCKTITEELPTGPNNTNGQPQVNIPVPVVVTPVQIPQTAAPAPGATESPAAPAPAAPQDAPPPSGGGPANSCAPTPGPGNERCPREGGSDFLGAIENAKNRVIQQRPSWFQREGSTIHILASERDWNWAVIGALRQAGYCAGMYAEEISVRTSRAYSENFDLTTSAHTVRTGEGSYRSTCYPASTTEE
jgi:hypothetical protein